MSYLELLAIVVYHGVRSRGQEEEGEVGRNLAVACSRVGRMGEVGVPRSLAAYRVGSSFFRFYWVISVI